MAIGLASIALLLFGKKRNIGGVIPDVVIQEVHDDAVTITQHPVEYGAAISDHAYREPSQIVMTVGWTPGSLLVNGVLSGSIFKGLQSLDDVYQSLLGIQRLREPFDLITGKRAYTDMMITALSVTTDKDTENALIVTVTMQEVLRARTMVIPAEPEKQAEPSKTSTPANAGVKQPQTPPATQNTSALKQAGDLIRGK